MARQETEPNVKQSERVALYLTPEDKQKLVEYAKRARLSISEMLSRIVFREAKKKVPYWEKIR